MFLQPIPVKYVKYPRYKNTSYMQAVDSIIDAEDIPYPQNMK